jgi:uncharacterized membrane protein YphA (DoxX/SURF4 family)
VPADKPRISRPACVFLVLLRLAIGWHLMYEGLWKLSTQHTSTPWTAEGYLKNATGPLRSHFREMTGDPNDLRWLDYDTMAAKWDSWRQRFIAHYAPGGELDGQLEMLLEGPGDYRAALDKLPDGLDLAKWKNSIQFDPAAKRLIVTKQHLLPSERDAILALVEIQESAVDSRTPDPAFESFKKALNEVYLRQSRLSFKERLAALLKGDPERVGIDQPTEQRMGQIAEYQALIKRYEDNYAKAKTAYQWDHLQRQWGELQQKRRELVGPVQALENELKTAAEALLSEQQLAAGPVPEPMTEIRDINQKTMWGLTILGALLIAGCFTRLAALGAAGFLTMFYLAVPPWPGTPPEVGPEHNFIVNKVLVEAIACVALVFLPTGRWFGVDAIFAWMFGRRAK